MYPKPVQDLAGEFESKVCLQLFTLIYFLRLERHRHRLRLHFGHDFGRRLGYCLGRVSNLRRIGLGRLAEVISSAQGSHKDGGDEDSSGRYGLLSHSDARQHRRRKNQDQVRQA